MRRPSCATATCRSGTTTRSTAQASASGPKMYGRHMPCPQSTQTHPELQGEACMPCAFPSDPPFLASRVVRRST